MVAGENLSTARQRLEALYLRTTYRISAANGPVDVRIGVRNAALDRILDTHRVSEWFFVTASNPGSRVHSEYENARHNAELEQMLGDAGWQYLHASGVPDGPGWQPESSYFVFGMTKPDAIALAKRWGQFAIVWGTRDSAPELVWID
jgi:hypothetical protein